MDRIEQLERELQTLKQTVDSMRRLLFATSTDIKKVASRTGVDLRRPNKPDSTQLSLYSD